MNRSRVRVVVIVGCFLLAVSLTKHGWGEEVRSGLEIGATPVPFYVKDCTGPAAGKTLCYFCRYGNRPVVAIFTRDLNDKVANLIKKTDDAVERHRDDRMAAFVVYIRKDTAKAEQRLKQIATTKRLRHTPLTILKESNEQLRLKYGISPDAAVTVMSWRNLQVHSSQAFDSAEIAPNDFAKLQRSVEALAD